MNSFQTDGILYKTPSSGFGNDLQSLLSDEQTASFDCKETGNNREE